MFKQALFTGPKTQAGCKNFKTMTRAEQRLEKKASEKFGLDSSQSVVLFYLSIDYMFVPKVKEGLATADLYTAFHVPSCLIFKLGGIRCFPIGTCSFSQ